MDGNRDYERHLIMASLSTTDRKKLYQLVKQYNYVSETTDNYTISGEVLELKDLSTLEGMPPITPADTDAPKAAAMEEPPPPGEADIEFLDVVPDPSATPSQTRTESDLDEISELEDLPDLQPPPATPVAQTGEPAAADVPPSPPLVEELTAGEEEEIEESADGLFDDEWIKEQLPHSIEELPDDTAATPTDSLSGGAGGSLPIQEDIPFEIANEDAMGEKPLADPAPSPKSNFESYNKQLQAKRPGMLSADLEALPRRGKNTPPVSKTDLPPLEDLPAEPADVAKEVAARSLHEDNTIVSETLAGILARQGHFEKAIKMYEQLSLQFPEKKDTFAAKIAELKNNRL
ncbi:MAG TPA: hypothetical protein ENJ20_02150 [Bacteroidetes bacterium]|nr:hypothetical protein [Bacteroidota bacterium]